MDIQMLIINASTLSAEIYVVNGFCRVKLLISKINADIIAYMALSADSFLVSQEEKDQLYALSSSWYR